MKTLPKILIPNNIDEFKNYRIKRQLSYVRRHIFESMLSKKFSIPKNCGISLQNIPMGGILDCDYDILDKYILDNISKELRELGWETSLSYGDTVLFVFTKGNSPEQNINCISMS